MKYLIYFILFIVSAFLSGCGVMHPHTQNYPQHSVIYKNYSPTKISSFNLNVNCTKAVITQLKSEFTRSYCSMLENNIKSFILAQNPSWRYDDSSSDINVKVDLELLHGGDVNGRFFFPGTNGPSAKTYLYATVTDNNGILAERRIFEYTKSINIFFDKFSNEETMKEDAISISEKVSDFVTNPSEYGSRYAIN